MSKSMREAIPSEKLLKHIERYAGVGIWWWLVGSDTVYWSDKTCDIFRVPTRTTPTLDEAITFYVLESRDRVSRELEQSLSSSQPFQFDAAIVDASGQAKHVESAGDVLDTEHGQLLFGTIVDVTGQKDHLLKLENQSVSLKAILNNLLDGVITIDDKGIVKAFSQPAECMFGYSAEEVIGNNIKMLMPEPYAREHDNYLSNYHDTGNKKIIGIGREVAAKRKDGTIFPIDLAVTQTDTHEGRRYIGTIRDITIQKENAERIEHLSFHDALTGLPNRQSFIKSLEAWHYSTGGIAVLALNVDYFSRINTVLGYTAGNEALLEIAKRIDEARISGTVVARDLGDRFWLAVPVDKYQHKDADFFCSKTEKILAEIRRPMSIDGEPLYLTASAGLVLGKEGQEPYELMASAEAALEHAKKAGRDRVMSHEPSLSSDIVYDFQIEKGLRTALTQENELECWLQSKVDRTGRVTGAEALVRWRRSDTLVSPDDFIPIAEKTGLIKPLGLWMAGQVAKAISETGLNIALNVSPQEFLSETFVHQLRTRFEQYSGALELLTIEVTENLLLSDVDVVTERMNELKQLGVHFSIDDFGTGYSNLARLQTLPVSELKIDKQFVPSLDSTCQSKALFEAMMAVGKAMQLSIVVEGVETKEQSEYIATIGTAVQQGYYHARPKPANEWILNH